MFHLHSRWLLAGLPSRFQLAGYEYVLELLGAKDPVLFLGAGGGWLARMCPALRISCSASEAKDPTLLYACRRRVAGQPQACIATRMEYI